MGGSLPAQTLNLLQAGGPVVVILIAISVVATAVLLLKLWQFSRSKVGRSGNGGTSCAPVTASGTLKRSRNDF